MSALTGASMVTAWLEEVRRGASGSGEEERADGGQHDYCGGADQHRDQPGPSPICSVVEIGRGRKHRSMRHRGRRRNGVTTVATCLESIRLQASPRQERGPVRAQTLVRLAQRAKAETWAPKPELEVWSLRTLRRPCRIAGRNLSPSCIVAPQFPQTLNTAFVFLMS